MKLRLTTVDTWILVRDQILVNMAASAPLEKIELFATVIIQVTTCKKMYPHLYNSALLIITRNLNDNRGFSGYIGENCHFATFRKTCEELALLGYTRNDVYLIDIDGNGKFPPAHVKCEFREIEADSSITVVEHNLPSQVVSDIATLYYGFITFNSNLAGRA